MPGPHYKNGSYLSEVIDIAFNDAESPQIVFRLRIMSEWNAAASDWTACSDQYERTIWMNIPHAEEHQPFVVMKLRQAGWKGTSFVTLRDDMLGKNVIVKNEIRVAKGGKYQGKEVEGWDFPLPPKESPALEHQPAVAKRLDSLLGSLLNCSGPGGSAQPAVAGKIPDD